MLTLCLSLSAAIYGFMQRYMPTNGAIAWLRTPRGVKWAIPVALVTTPVYLGLTALAIQGASRPGLGWLNVLVFLLFWNAMKFAWLAVLSPLLMIRNHISHKHQKSVGARAYESSSFTSSVSAAISA